MGDIERVRLALRILDSRPAIVAFAVKVDWSVVGLFHCLDGSIPHCVDQLSIRTCAKGLAHYHAVGKNR